VPETKTAHAEKDRKRRKRPHTQKKMHRKKCLKQKFFNNSSKKNNAKSPFFLHNGVPSLLEYRKETAKSQTMAALQTTVGRSQWNPALKTQAVLGVLAQALHVLNALLVLNRWKYWPVNSFLECLSFSLDTSGPFCSETVSFSAWQGCCGGIPSDIFRWLD